jgi:hypothetical protein
MLPKLVIAMMAALGLVLLVRAAESPPLAEIAWGDFQHALRVVVVAAAAIALYTGLGFLVTMALMLFTLIFLVERRPVLSAAAFSLGITGIAYLLFGTFLKSPLPRGILWF